MWYLPFISSPRKHRVITVGVITPNKIIDDHTNISLKKRYRSRISNIGPLYLHAVWYLPFTNSPRKHTVITVGVITPNQIPLTTINISSKKVTEAEFQTIGPLYLHAVWYLPILQTVQENILSRIILATYRKFTVATVRFTQNVSCNIYTHPKCHCVIIHQTPKATEYTG